MEINLKQPELFKAIRQYLESQGFNTRGKEVTISVSGGRGTSGAWANISIEDSDIPGYEANSTDAPIIPMEGDDTPSPALADAAPAPEHPPELIGEPYPYAGMTDNMVVGIEMAKEEPSLDTSDSELFGSLPSGQPVAEEAKPAAPTTPSSLFDE